jgi:hypothetical protein
MTTPGSDSVTRQWGERIAGVIDCGLFHVFSDDDHRRYATPNRAAASATNAMPSASKWLSRRSRTRSMHWARLRRLLQRYPLAGVRTVRSVYRHAANP